MMRAEHRNPSTGLIELHGRRAMVTGAARGIGLRVAELLGAAGASVCLSDRDTVALDDAVASLRASDLQVTGCPADVTVAAELDRLVAAAAGPSGQLDIVVANAGRMTTGGVRQIGLHEWEEGLRDNLTSAFLTCRAAVPALRRCPAGRLVLLSSGAGFDPRTVAGVSYAVAKAGVAHLGRLLSVELAGTGITVNVVAPGAVDTSMARGFGDDVIAELARRSPLGRIATADDVARVVLFLASDLGGFVNGEVVRVAGGP
jgi:3-oxoacyl-[acyl-carrier protein] reductase